MHPGSLETFWLTYEGMNRDQGDPVFSLCYHGLLIGNINIWHSPDGAHGPLHGGDGLGSLPGWCPQTITRSTPVGLDGTGPADVRTPGHESLDKLNHGWLAGRHLVGLLLPFT